MADYTPIHANGETVMVLVKANGAVINLASAIDTVEAFIETKDLDGGDPHIFKQIQGILMQMSNPGLFPNLQIVLKTRNYLKDPWNEVVLDASLSDYLIRTRVRNCKFFRLRIQDGGVQVRWHLTRIDVYGAVAGQRL